MNSDDIARVALSGMVHHTDDFYIAAVVMSAMVLIALGVPAMVLSYRLKSRRLAAVEAQDGGATQGLWDTARRMEERIGYLETVLDTEVPGWRNRSNLR